MDLKIELFVKNSCKSAKFYQDYFNFKVIKDEENGKYIGMKSGKIKLAINTISSLSKNHYFRPEIKKKRLGLGIEIVFEVKDIQKIYQKIKESYPLEDELKLQPWRKKDFRVKDPDGYYIRVTTKS